MKSGKTRLVGRPLLSRLRRRFAPLRGAIFCPSGALRALRAARAAFLETRKKCPFS
jgi:hypothetical protein